MKKSKLLLFSVTALLAVGTVGVTSMILNDSESPLLAANEVQHHSIVLDMNHKPDFTQGDKYTVHTYKHVDKNGNEIFLDIKGFTYLENGLGITAPYDLDISNPYMEDKLHHNRISGIEAITVNFDKGNRKSRFQVLGYNLLESEIDASNSFMNEIYEFDVLEDSVRCEMTNNKASYFKMHLFDNDLNYNPINVTSIKIEYTCQAYDLYEESNGCKLVLNDAKDGYNVVGYTTRNKTVEVPSSHNSLPVKGVYINNGHIEFLDELILPTSVERVWSDKISSDMPGEPGFDSNVPFIDLFIKGDKLPQMEFIEPKTIYAGYDKTYDDGNCEFISVKSKYEGSFDISNNTTTTTQIYGYTHPVLALRKFYNNAVETYNIPKLLDEIEVKEICSESFYDFYEKSKLTTVTVPNVYLINSHAFCSFPSLKTINLDGNIANIQINMIHGCHNASIVVNGINYKPLGWADEWNYDINRAQGNREVNTTYNA